MRTVTNTIYDSVLYNEDCALLGADIMCIVIIHSYFKVNHDVEVLYILNED